MLIRLSAIADFFGIAANFLHVEYAESTANYDARKWQDWAEGKHYSINSKLKYKSEYICAKDHINATTCIPVSNVVSLDETMIWHDFCVDTKTLSFKGRNTEVA
eukprot:71980_1